MDMTATASDDTFTQHDDITSFRVLTYHALVFVWLSLHSCTYQS